MVIPLLANQDLTPMLFPSPSLNIGIIGITFRRGNELTDDIKTYDNVAAL